MTWWSYSRFESYKSLEKQLGKNEEPPKEGNEFSWLQVGGVLKQGEANFSLKNGAGKGPWGRP